MPDAVERLAVAYEDSQRALARRSRNLQWNLLHDALAAVGSEHGFECNVVARASFSHVSACAFQAGPAALAHQVKIQLHVLDSGSVVGIVVDTSEALTQRDRSLHGRGLPIFRGSEHVTHR